MTAELPLAHLLMGEPDQRLLGKDGRVAGVAAEGLVRAVREERARRIRPDGIDQYVEIAGDFEMFILAVVSGTLSPGPGES